MPKTSRPRRQSSTLNGWTSSDDDSRSNLALPAPRGRYYGRRPPASKPARVHFDSSLDEATPGKKRCIPSDHPMRVHDSSDDSSDDESLAVKQTSRASRHAERATGRAPSFPAFTPIVTKARPAPSHSRATIRINLTPTRNDDTPWGWCTKSQLLEVARRHNGMAIQYRVMYHSAVKPIRDHNPGKPRQIRCKDLVVQSRFACASGSHGGSTYSFMRWKLPGTLLQSRNAKHVTIYDDTRPRLLELGGKETSHPLIVLCGELMGRDRRMAERFLRQADAGMTPEMFYSHDQTQNSLEGFNDNSVTDSVEGEESFPATQDDRVDDEFAEGEIEKLPHRQRPTKRTKSGDKRKRSINDAGNSAKPAKKKAYGGDRRRSCEKVAFRVRHDNASSPQFLALVEGVAEGSTGSVGPNERAQDYIRDIFMNGRVENLPTTGRVLELPGEAKPGSWTGEVVGKDSSDRGATTGMLRDKFGSLKNVRILLRHDSAQALGPLEFTPGDDSLSTLSYRGGSTKRIRGGGSRCKKQADSLGGLTVSLVDPSHSRQGSLLSQCIVAKEASETFIGSISIASFDGFTSSADACISARSISGPLLERCRQNAIDAEVHGSGSSSFLEGVLPIPATRKPISDRSHNVGVSFVCKVAIHDVYGLLLAHDEAGRIVAADVVFDESVFQGRSSLSSTSTSLDASTPKLMAGMLRIHSEDMEQVASGKSVDESAYSEDNAGIFVDDDHLESSPLAPDDDASEKENFANTLDREGSKSDNMARVESHANVPGTLSKMKRNVISDVTPAPMVTVATIGADHQITTRLPFVTPTPIRSKQAFLARLERVAGMDAELVEPGEHDQTKENNGDLLDDAMGYEFDRDALKRVSDKEMEFVYHGQVDHNEEYDSDWFADSINSEFDNDASATGSNSIHSVECGSANALVEKEDAHVGHATRRWPSIHNVFYGLHDDAEHVECTFEEMQTLAFPAAPTGNFSELHGFFFDPDDDTILSETASTRRTVLRSSRLSTVRFFAIAFGLWQATLVPNGSVVNWTMFPQRSFPAVDYPAFGYDWNLRVDNSQKTAWSTGPCFLRDHSPLLTTLPLVAIGIRHQLKFCRRLLVAGESGLEAGGD